MRGGHRNPPDFGFFPIRGQVILDFRFWIEFTLAKLLSFWESFDNKKSRQIVSRLFRVNVVHLTRWINKKPRGIVRSRLGCDLRE
jgi:hypothetical protein